MYWFKCKNKGETRERRNDAHHLSTEMRKFQSNKIRLHEKTLSQILPENFESLTSIEFLSSSQWVSLSTFLIARYVPQFHITKKLIKYNCNIFFSTLCTKIVASRGYNRTSKKGLWDNFEQSLTQEVCLSVRVHSFISFSQNWLRKNLELKLLGIFGPNGKYFPCLSFAWMHFLLYQLKFHQGVIALRLDSPLCYHMDWNINIVYHI